MATADQGSVKFSVRVVPGSARDEFAGARGGAIVVRLRARPIKGAANKALLAFLGEALELSPTDITIVAGHRARNKTVRVTGLDAAGLKNKLRQAEVL